MLQAGITAAMPTSWLWNQRHKKSKDLTKHTLK